MTTIVNALPLHQIMGATGEVNSTSGGPPHCANMVDIGYVFLTKARMTTEFILPHISQIQVQSSR
jgi:hypothetical protein